MPLIALAAGIIFQLVTNFAMPGRTYEPLADPTSLTRLAQNEEAAPPASVDTVADFHGTELTAPDGNIESPVDAVLGTSTAYNQKRIEVDLTNQKAYAFEGNRKVYEFVISSGLWGRTPTGTFTIWTKVRSQLMQGGKKELGTYYYLPNVPYVMFFYNDKIEKMRGFSFHGTYWHNNFGHPMSHGCINMKTEEAKILYEWATPVVTNPKAWSTPATNENPGTTVIIYGTAPTG